MARFHVSDEEYVARIRRTEKGRSIYFVWISVFQLVAAITFVCLIVQMGPLWLGNPKQQIALTIGILQGTLLGLVTVTSGYSIVLFLYLRRMPKLLLRYHDELAALKGRRSE